MSRARNRADGDFGDLDVTNIGAVSLDSIKGDADGNTSLAFSGSDVITITTGGSTAATFNASQALTLSGNLLIPNAGTIGSAGDTNAISISSGGVVAVTATTANTSATDGALTVAGGVGIAADLSVGDDLRLISDSAVLSFGADSDTTLTHTDGTGLTLNSTNKLTFGDAASFIQQSSNGTLRIDGEAIVDINASTAVQISHDMKLQSDGAILGFGVDNDVTLTHVSDEALMFNDAIQLRFRDSALLIGSSTDGQLDIDADTEVEITATTIDINGAVEISGTTTQTGISTSAAKDIFNASLSVKNGSTSAGFIEFFEDSDNGTNKVTLIGPASTSDVTLTLGTATGTIATTDDATALAIALG